MKTFWFVFFFFLVSICILINSCKMMIVCSFHDVFVQCICFNSFCKCVMISFHLFISTFFLKFVCFVLTCLRNVKNVA